MKKATATKVITTSLAVILTLNKFVFNSKHFLQIKGCRMGIICAPSYKSILMNDFEQKYMYS